MTSKDLSIPAFEATPLEYLPVKYNTLRTTYRSGRTRDIEYRLKQLRKFYWAVCDAEELMKQAVYKDLKKCEHEAVMTEISWCKGEAMDQIDNLKKWSKDSPVPGVPATFWAMKHRMRKEPLGTILIIGSFNYPFQLTLLPMLGAIAAGNTVLVKPSELSPHSAMVTKMIVEKLDPESYAIANGALPVSQALLNMKWDKIAFTGGRTVGTIIARKAAETLTPVLLELGGQNPAFITKNGNVKLAARRLLWGKTTNAGQVCLSHNYVIIERSRVDEFVNEINRQYKVFMPQGAKASPDYCRIVNKANFNRIKSMLDNTSGKFVMGGTTDELELFIEPTAVLHEGMDTKDSMIREESFGPIWSIIPYDNLDDAINFVNEVDPTPLTLFTFGIMSSVTSGGATVNDTFAHASINCAPFGGVGQSGQGSYHGIYSFENFSHHRCVARTPNWVESLLRVRYMPYQDSDLKMFTKISSKKANFNRDGNVNKGLGYWLGVVFGLGSSSSKGAALRWGILLVLAVSLGLKRKSTGL